MYEFIALKKISEIESHTVRKILVKINIESFLGDKKLPIPPDVFEGKSIPWYKDPNFIFFFFLLHFNISKIRRYYPFIKIITNDEIVKLGSKFDHRFSTGFLDNVIISKYDYIKLNNIEYTRLGKFSKAPEISSILIDVGIGDLMDFSGGIIETMLPFSYIILLSKNKTDINKMKYTLENAEDTSKFEKYMLEYSDVIVYFYEPPEFYILTNDKVISESISY